MLVNPSGSLNSPLKPLQPLKASAPILVNPSGSLNSPPKPLQLKKAFSPMLVNPSSNTIVFITSLYSNQGAVEVFKITSPLTYSQL